MIKNVEQSFFRSENAGNFTKVFYEMFLSNQMKFVSYLKRRNLNDNKVICVPQLAFLSLPNWVMIARCQSWNPSHIRTIAITTTSSPDTMTYDSMRFAKPSHDSFLNSHLHWKLNGEGT